MSKSTTRTTVLGFAVVAGLLLTGCSAGADTLIPTVPSDLGTETSAPAKPVNAPATGDIVDATIAAELKDAAEGQRGYPLDDGTFVVVNKNEPLPAVVQADIDAKAGAFLVPPRDITADINRSITAPGQAAIPIAKNTGKRVIVAWQVYGYHYNLEFAETFWMVSGGTPMDVHYADQASAQSVIDGWLATKDDAATYAVVYVA